MLKRTCKRTYVSVQALSATTTSYNLQLQGGGTTLTILSIRITLRLLKIQTVFKRGQSVRSVGIRTIKVYIIFIYQWQLNSYNNYRLNIGKEQKQKIRGSGYSSAGRTVASETRDIQFKSSHGRILYSIICIEKMKIKKKKRGWTWPIINESDLILWLLYRVLSILIECFVSVTVRPIVPSGTWSLSIITGSH